MDSEGTNMDSDNMDIAVAIAGIKTNIEWIRKNMEDEQRRTLEKRESCEKRFEALSRCLGETERKVERHEGYIVILGTAVTATIAAVVSKVMNLIK